MAAMMNNTFKPLMIKTGEPRYVRHICRSCEEGKMMTKHEQKRFAMLTLMDLYDEVGLDSYPYYNPTGEYPDFALVRDKKLAQSFYVVVVRDTVALPEVDASAALRLYNKYGTFPMIAYASMLCTETMDPDKPLCGGTFVFKFCYRSPLEQPVNKSKK